MPEITAVQYMTENLSEWLRNDSIESMTLLPSANTKRIQLHNLSLPTGNAVKIFRRGKIRRDLSGRDSGFAISTLWQNRVVSPSQPPPFARVRFQLKSGKHMYWVDKISCWSSALATKKGRTHLDFFDPRTRMLAHPTNGHMVETTSYGNGPFMPSSSINVSWLNWKHHCHRSTSPKQPPSRNTSTLTV